MAKDRQARLQAEQDDVRARMRRIRHKLLVLSGKGGVGKSTVTVVTGAPAEPPEDLVTRYLASTLETGTNVCDH